MTPSEIEQSYSTGARLIKLSPANILGLGFIRSIKELFPGVRFILTGGIGIKADELKPWFRTGAAALGLGSALIEKMVKQ